MTLLKFNPFAPVTVNRAHNLDQWVNEFFNDDMGMKFNFTTPSVNVVEAPNSFKIEVAAPGMAKEDFKINIEKDVLTISAEKKVENTEGDEDQKGKFERFIRKEFAYATFKRSFKLPENLKMENVKATYENGILCVTLPKNEQQKISQSINIE